jgi:hypothetical protein
MPSSNVVGGLMIICNFLSHGARDRIRTVDLRIMSSLFYHCATKAQPSQIMTFAKFIFPCAKTRI